MPFGNWQPSWSAPNSGPLCACDRSHEHGSTLDRTLLSCAFRPRNRCSWTCLCPCCPCCLCCSCLCPEKSATFETHLVSSGRFTAKVSIDFYNFLYLYQLISIIINYISTFLCRSIHLGNFGSEFWRWIQDLHIDLFLSRPKWIRGVP